MWPLRELKYLQPATYTRRTSAYVDRDFQERITRYLIGLSTLSSVLFLLPALYFTNQNYSLFLDFADISSPQLAPYLMRERVGLNVIFILAFLVQVVFWYVFTKKMTEKIAAPAKVLRNHLRIASRGDFSLAPVRIREGDEFKDLINSYNYFYKLLQSQYLRELEDLKRIKAGETNPASLKILDQLIEERALRLNLPDELPYRIMSSLHGEAPAKPRGSRHVS